jgi:hypothetical protein
MYTKEGKKLPSFVIVNLSVFFEVNFVFEPFRGLLSAALVSVEVARVVSCPSSTP